MYKLTPILQKKNKRGSIIDIVFLIVVLLGLSMLILVIAKVFPSITSALKSSALNTSSASMAALNNSDSISHGLDYIFIVVFAGLTIGIFITSYRIESSPGLAVVYIILLALLVVISAVGQFVYGMFSTQSDIIAGVSYSPMMDNIMSHLIMASIGVGVISFILIFAKPRAGGGF